MTVTRDREAVALVDAVLRADIELERPDVAAARRRVLIFRLGELTRLIHERIEMKGILQ